MNRHKRAQASVGGSYSSLWSQDGLRFQLNTPPEAQPPLTKNVDQFSITPYFKASGRETTDHKFRAPTKLLKGKMKPTKSVSGLKFQKFSSWANALLVEYTTDS